MGRDWITTCVKATKSGVKGRASGGTIVGIRRELRERITVVEEQLGIYIKIKVENGSRCIIPAYINCNNWNLDFENLQNLINSNKLEDLIIIGDLNARIGAFQGTGKRFINDQLHKERNSKDPIVNSNGKDLIELIHEQDLVVLNGRTDGDKEGNITFATRAGQSVNDYCLVEGRIVGEVRDMRVGCVPWSDHLPLELSLKPPQEKQNATRRTLPPKITLQEHRRESYKARLEKQNFELIGKGKDIEDHLSSMLEKMKSCLDSKTQAGKLKSKNPWFNGRCNKSKKDFRRAHSKFKKTNRDDDRVKYVEERARYARVIYEEKMEYYIHFAKELNDCKSSKEFWSKVNYLKGEHVASEIGASLETLRNHFLKELGTKSHSEGDEPASVEKQQSNGELEIKISEEEVEKAINQMKCGKAAGPDRLTAEVYRCLPKSGIKELTNIFNKILREEKAPRAFKEAILFPIFKKGQRDCPSNYRGIALLNVVGKIFTKILQERLGIFAERKGLLSKCQAAYRRGRSAMEHIYTMDGIVEIQRRRGKKVYVCFMDMTAAYDTVNRKLLISKVRDMFKSDKIANIIKDLYEGTSLSVWNGIELAEGFETVTGVRQGCNLSGLLFNIYLNDLENQLKGGISVGNATVNLLMYADDLVIIAESRDVLQKLVNKTIEHLNSLQLKVNISKTKWMVFNQKGRPPRESIWINRQCVERVSSFKFLGVILQQNGSFDKALTERKNKAMGALGAMKKVMRDGSIDFSVKEKIFKATVSSILFYGVEVWGRNPTEDIEKPARSFYKSLFGLPRSTPNYFLKTELDIDECACQARTRNLQFLGKILQMEDGRLPKMIMEELGELNEEFIEEKGKIIQRIRSMGSRNLINKARGYEGSGGRLLYQTLRYGEMSDRYKEGDSRENELFMRARLEILQGVGFLPYQRNEPKCSRCGITTRDDMVHFLGKCAFFDIIREIKLGRRTLNLEELRAILNDFNCRDKIKQYIIDMSEVSNAMGRTRE